MYYESVTSVVITLTTLLSSLGYAILRYNIVRNVPVESIPLYVSNKAIALSTVVLIGLSFLLGPLARFWPKQFVPHLYLRKSLGLTGFALAALHAMISLLLFSPAYYPRLFLANGKMNLIGESSMLFGILAFLIFAGISVISLPPIEKTMIPAQWKFVKRLGYLAYILVLFHVVSMGWNGWFLASAWKYGLASISLISALVIILVLVMRVLVIAFPKKISS